MMEFVVLEWEKTSYKNLSNMEDCYFYTLSRGPTLLYIGIAYFQDVQSEVKNTIRDFDLNIHGLTIWLGYIEETSYKRITEQIIKDVECLLIFTHQPPYNTHCTSSYTGRNNLKVENQGCPYLKPCVKVERGYIYDEC